VSWAQILGAGGIGSLVTLLLGLLAWQKIRAETRKIDAEAETIDYVRITSEVARLERIVKSQGRLIGGMRSELDALAKTNLDLELENRRQRARIAELEGMAPPQANYRGRPATGVSDALRAAVPPQRDVEGLRMADRIEEGLRDVPGTDELRRKGMGR